MSNAPKDIRIIRAIRRFITSLFMHIAHAYQFSYFPQQQQLHIDEIQRYEMSELSDIIPKIPCQSIGLFQLTTDK